MSEIKNEFVFSDNDANQWLIKISKEGILFNREVYTDSGPDDFAKAFINALERKYGIIFYERSNIPGVQSHAWISQEEAREMFGKKKE